MCTTIKSLSIGKPNYLLNKRIVAVFEFKFSHSELEALDAILKACIEQYKDTLPAWNYMGQNVWDMNFDGDGHDAIGEWAIETASVA